MVPPKAKPAVTIAGLFLACYAYSFGSFPPSILQSCKLSSSTKRSGASILLLPTSERDYFR